MAVFVREIRSAKIGAHSKSMAFGFVQGLSAASVLIADVIPRPRTPKATVRSDWEAVGQDIRQAALKHASQRTA